MDPQQLRFRRRGSVPRPVLHDEHVVTVEGQPEWRRVRLDADGRRRDARAIGSAELRHRRRRLTVGPAEVLTLVNNRHQVRRNLVALVIAFDGWNVYFDLCLKIFSEPIYSGRKGRRAMKIWKQLTLVQVVKHTHANTWAGIRQVLWGSCTSLQRLIERTQGAGGINTAYIERLNATFRGHLSVLVRRSRCPARRVETITQRVFLLGCVYNFCTLHSSFRDRTPAMAAGLTDHLWTVADLLWSRPNPFSLPTT